MLSKTYKKFKNISLIKNIMEKKIITLAFILLLVLSLGISLASTIDSNQSGTQNSNQTSDNQLSQGSPITLVAFTNELVSHNTTTVSSGYVNFPSGNFSEIELYYENIYKSNPWDYSYAIVLNGVEVASGNTYEMQNTTVSENITEYSSILLGRNVSVKAYTAEWEPGYAAYQSVWFVLYPGKRPANIPDVVVPVVNNIGIYTPKNPIPNNVLIPYNVSRLYNVTFPNNTTSGYLNLYALQNGNDEGWYSNQPPFREFVISVNGTIIARIWPYPNVQTGGWNLFNWQPIHAIGALLDKPYVFNLNPYAYLLKGRKVVNITVVNDEDQWIRVGLNFMLYTGGNYTYHSWGYWNISNQYTQTPATNMTTESIPTNATWLNDSDYVWEHLTLVTDYNYSNFKVKEYENITNHVAAYSMMYDPNFNIVQPYGSGYLIPFNQTFSYKDYINSTYIQRTFNSTGSYSISKYVSRIYYISMKFTYDILLAKNGSLSGIILSDNIVQQRFIQSNTIYDNNTDIYVRTTLSNDIVSGSGGFEGVIVNGVIVNLTYNYAYTTRINIYYTYASWNLNAYSSSGYEQILEAVNNSTVNRDGVLILNKIIML